jgi:hypothetical protein
LANTPAKFTPDFSHKGRKERQEDFFRRIETDNSSSSVLIGGIRDKNFRLRGLCDLRVKKASVFSMPFVFLKLASISVH